MLSEAPKVLLINHLLNVDRFFIWDDLILSTSSSCLYFLGSLCISLLLLLYFLFMHRSCFWCSRLSSPYRGLGIRGRYGLVLNDIHLAVLCSNLSDLR